MKKNTASGTEYIYKKGNSWVAMVYTDGKIQTLGQFRTIEAAILERNNCLDFMAQGNTYQDYRDSLPKRRNHKYISRKGKKFIVCIKRKSHSFWETHLTLESALAARDTWLQNSGVHLIQSND